MYYVLILLVYSKLKFIIIMLTITVSLCWSIYKINDSPFSPLVCLLLTHWCYWIDQLSSCLLCVRGKLFIKKNGLGVLHLAFNNYRSLNFSNKLLKLCFVAELGINTDFPIQSDSNSFGYIIVIISFFGYIWEKWSLLMLKMKAVFDIDSNGNSSLWNIQQNKLIRVISFGKRATRIGLMFSIY